MNFLEYYDLPAHHTKYANLWFFLKQEINAGVEAFQILYITTVGG